MRNNIPFYKIFFAVSVCLCILTGNIQTLTASEGVKTIAILPFKINSSEDLTYIREGMFQMLYSRLSWKDNVVVVPAKKVREYLSVLDKKSEGSGIDQIARLTHSDFVMAGTVTRLGGSFSIDVQVYDIKNKKYITFFEQSQKTDEIIKKTSSIAAFINKKVFDRTTYTWKKMEEEKQAYIKEQKRRNPEYMMKNPEWQDTEKSPGWKIWEYLF